MKPLFPFAAALLLLFTAVGCSKDDAPNDPEGTVSLNMLNSDNGHTWLGNMGVYIDSSDNFVCRNCSMAARTAGVIVYYPLSALIAVGVS